MKADGGAAFPRAPFEVNDYCGDGSPGMSLRDYFAGQALMGILANPTTITSDVFKSKDGWHSPELMAMHAYETADTMLAERERGSDEADI